MPRTRSAPPRGARVPQQARSHRTRERIVEAAVEAFAAGGFDGTTTAAIARRAGIGVGTLYAYFPDKRALLLEILESTTRGIVDFVVAELEPGRWGGADARGQIRRLVEASCAARRANDAMMRIVWERYFKDGAFQEAVGGIERRLRGALAGLIEAEAAAGRMRAVDPRAAAYVVHAAVDALSAGLAHDDGSVDPAAAIEATTDLVWRFLFEPAGAAPASVPPI